MPCRFLCRPQRGAIVNTASKFAMAMAIKDRAACVASHRSFQALIMAVLYMSYIVARCVADPKPASAYAVTKSRVL